MWIPDGVLDHVRAVTDEPDLTETKYELLRVLGRGGMGTVYAALDTAPGREVALKLSLGAESSETRERLRREARVLARLEHPGIVPVHDVGTLPDGRVFYVMKLVQGEPLDAWVRRLPERRAVLSLFRRIGASALDLVEDVGRFLDGSPVGAHEETVFDRAARFAARHRVVLPLVAAYILVRLLIVYLGVR
jgi:hypothetical protein